MAERTLVIGNKNYSSWSMRGWLALRAAGLEFDEQVILMDTEQARQQRRELCPARRVPVLHVGATRIWDSLAIAEYAAEHTPRVWPQEAAARAVARSVCAEMHAGFPDLRAEMPLNCRARREPREHGRGLARDIARISELWTELRAGFGAGGAFLFGAWSLADVFYAPVVSRFQTYSVEQGAVAMAYREAVLAHPDVAAWLAGAASEEHEIARFEV